MAPRQLHGWKDIAGYLGRGVRAAQRWEKDLGLPVHRIPTQSGHAVYALPEELDAWRAEAEGRDVHALAPVSRDEDPVAGDDGALDAMGAPAFTDGHVPPSVIAAGAVPAIETTALPTPPPARVTAWSARWWAVAVLIATVGIGGWIAVDRLTPPPAARAPRESFAQGFTEVDAGPWPVTGGNPYRTARSRLRGPSQPPAARVVFDATPAFVSPGSPLAASAVGALLVGTTDGRVVAFDLSGAVRWTQTLDRTVNPEAAFGLTLSKTQVFVSTRAFPIAAHSNPRTQFTALDLASGAVRFRHRTGGQGFPASIGTDGAIYQPDAYNTLRRYDSLGTVVWIVDFPGFTLLPPFETPGGQLLVLTDGAVYGQESVYTLDRDGRVRTRNGTGSYVGAAMLPGGDVVAIDLAMSVGRTRDGVPSLRRLSAGGEPVWLVPIAEGFPGGVAPEPAVGESDVLLRTATHLVALRFDGTERWRAVLPPGVGSPGPILDRDGNVYVAIGGKVLSFTGAGSLRWQVDVRDEVSEALTAGITGTLRLIIPAEGRLLLATGRRIVALE